MPRPTAKTCPALLASDQWQSRKRIAGRPPSGAWGSTARVAFGDVQVAPTEVQTVIIAVMDHLFLTGARNKTGNGGQTALDLPVLASDVALARAARERLDDSSPLVRDAARWALGRLIPKAGTTGDAPGA